MPWDSSDASKSTKKAKTAKQRDQWAAVANSVLEKTGDDGQAKRIANGVVKKSAFRSKRARDRSDKVA